MRGKSLIYALLILQGCVSIGSKTALVNVQDNEWKIDGLEYRFDGRDIIVTIREVKLAERSRAIGVILPIIPLSHEANYEDKELEIQGTVLGFPSWPDTPEYKMSISVEANGAPIEGESGGAKGPESTTNNPQGRLWRQYSVRGRYRIRLGAIQDLTLRFRFPMFVTQVPDLHLSRRDVADNWIVLTPGP